MTGAAHAVSLYRSRSTGPGGVRRDMKPGSSQTTSFSGAALKMTKRENATRTAPAKPSQIFKAKRERLGEAEAGAEGGGSEFTSIATKATGPRCGSDSQPDQSGLA